MRIGKRHQRRGQKLLALNVRPGEPDGDQQDPGRRAGDPIRIDPRALIGVDSEQHMRRALRRYVRAGQRGERRIEPLSLCAHRLKVLR